MPAEDFVPPRARAIEPLVSEVLTPRVALHSVPVWFWPKNFLMVNIRKKTLSICTVPDLVKQDSSLLGQVGYSHLAQIKKLHNKSHLIYIYRTTQN